MQAEVIAWESEKQDLEEYEAETERLREMLKAGQVDELLEIAAQQRHGGPLVPDVEEDVEALIQGADDAGTEAGEIEEEDLIARQEARAAIEWALALQSGTVAAATAQDSGAGAKKGRQSKGKGKAAAIPAVPTTQADLDGSEHDKRWQEVEFNVSPSSWRDRSHTSPKRT